MAICPNRKEHETRLPASAGSPKTGFVRQIREFDPVLAAEAYSPPGFRGPSLLCKTLLAQSL